MFAFCGNASATDVTGNESGVWSLSGSPYIVKGNITVPEDSILTVEPGVEVRFDGWCNISILGTFIADGNSSANILFTSNRVSPDSGDWQCIFFRDTTHSIMDYCIVEYGGSWGDASVLVGNYFNSITGFCEITNCIIRKSSAHGIGVEWYSSPIISNNTITDNTSYGINIYNSCEPTITNNSITNNGSFAINMDMSCIPTISGNTASGNMYDGIGIQGGTMTKSGTWGKNLPFFIRTTTDVVDTGATLTIEPGTTVNFIADGYSGIEVTGAIIAEGTINDSIIFTSAGSSPQAGDWQSIKIDYSRKTSVFDYCRIEYGYCGIYLGYNTDTCKITNSIIRHTSYGIDIYKSPALIMNNIITNNGSGIYCSDSATPIINYNTIMDNTDDGVYNAYSLVTVNAENNWWGDSTGPSGVGPGTGDAVSNYVDYSPWTGMIGISEASTCLTFNLGLSSGIVTSFSSGIDIYYGLPYASNLKLKIYDCTGGLIKTLVDMKRDAGNYKTRWDFKNVSGNKVSSGIYFVKIQTENFISSRKILILR